MNQVSIIANSSAATMSSREIAVLCEKEHTHVLRDIRAMLDQLEITESSFGSSYKDSTGRKLPCFNLPKDLTLTLVSGYNVVLRKRIIDRMTELEAAAPAKITAPKRAPDPALAAIRTAKALQMNIESAAAIRAMFPSLGEQSHQVIFSKIVGGDVIPLPMLENRTYTATEVAAKLGTSANAIGRSANSLGLKTTQYGIFVLDKSKSSDKQVETFRYNDAGVARLADLLGVAA